jgi:hypothetical protein
MKILIISDSHGNVPALRKIIAKELPCDYIIHCGDGVMDVRECDTGDAVEILVSGNMDLGRTQEYERIIVTSIGDFKMYITHGDIQRAHQDVVELHEEGRRNGCNAVIFGHTHRQYIGEGNPILFNPGPAQNGMYGLLIIGMNIEFIHKRLEG